MWNHLKAYRMTTNEGFKKRYEIWHVTTIFTYNAFVLRYNRLVAHFDQWVMSYHTLIVHPERNSDFVSFTCFLDTDVPGTSQDALCVMLRDYKVIVSPNLIFGDKLTTLTSFLVNL